MYTAIIGKTFLREYNARHGTEYVSKDFFEQVLFRQVFDAKRYLMWVQNSPFVQGISKTKPFFSVEERQEKLTQLSQKISQGEADASIAIGYPASESKEFASTSGQVNDLIGKVLEEEIYASWIGGALSIGVAGGYSILFDDPEICYQVFEGWAHYRRYLDDPAMVHLRPNQLASWNGQWLTFRAGKRYREDFDFNHLLQRKMFSQKPGLLEVNTVQWSSLFFSLSHSLGAQSRMAYVFALGQTNKTIGFIPFQFRVGKLIHEVLRQLTGPDYYQKKSKDFELLFGKHIKRACELGSIGLHALEPPNLSKYFANEKNLKLAKHTDPERDENNLITFYTYKTWLTAMLSKNQTEISTYSESIAQILVQYRAAARKTDRKNLIEKSLFATKRKEKFIETLTEIVSDPEVAIEVVHQMKSLRDRVHLMSREDFGYFVLLLKFDYAYQERIS